MPARLTFGDFSGGLWLPSVADDTPSTRQPGFAVPVNGLLQAQDVEFLPSGGLRGRRGKSHYGTVDGPITGMYRHYPRSEATSEGPLLATGATSDPGSGVWANETNVELEDGVPATITFGVGDIFSGYLRCTFGGFAIPGGATITGIQVDVKRRAQVPTTNPGEMRDYAVQLFRQSTAEASPEDRAATFLEWPSYVTGFPVVPAFVWLPYGGPADLWGFTEITVAEVNAAQLEFLFSVVSANFLAVIGEIDAIRMTVFFTSPMDPTFILTHQSGSTDLQYELDDGNGSFSPIADGLVPLPPYRPRFVSWPEKNKTFIFDGLNAVRSWNGITLEVVPTGGINGFPPHRGPYATLHQNRLYATDPAELNFSVYASEILDETEWPAFLQLSVNDSQGGSIVGLVSLGPRLLIFKTSGVWAFLGDPDPVAGGALLEKYSDRGCVAPDSIQLTPFGVLYQGRDAVLLTDGQEVIDVSTAIRPLFVERTTQHVYPLALAVYYPRKMQYILTLEPANTADVTTYILTRLQSPGQEPALPWALRTNARMNAWSVWDSEQDNGELYGGDDNGDVFQFDVGTLDVAAAFSPTMQTASRLLDPEGRRLARVSQLLPLLRLPQGSVNAMNWQLRYANSAFGNVLDTSFVQLLDLGVSVLTSTYYEPRRYITERTKFGRFLSVYMTGGGTGPDFELHRIDCDVQFRGARRWLTAT